MRLNLFTKNNSLDLRFILLSIFVCVTLVACATNPVTGRKDLVLVSEEQELEGMGERYHPHLVKYYGGEYDDPPLKAYVAQVGKKLSQYSHRDHLIYHFTILDTDQVNAFATPGYIYITRGMLAYLNSEAELAAVLGHEMGHIAARHSVRQHAKSQLAAILMQVLAQSQNGSLLPNISQFISTAVVRGYGRGNELEADRLGVEYLAKTGYQPDQILEVLRILKSHEEFEKQLAEEQNRRPNVYHGVFATHPDNEKRLREAAIVAAERQQEENTAEIKRQEYLDRIQGLTFGSLSKGGVVRNNHFYHADLGITFTFPGNWLTRNSPSQFVVTNLKNTSTILLQVEDRNRKQTPEEFLEMRFKGFEQGTSMALDAELPGQTAVLKRIGTPYGYKRSRIGVLFFRNKVFKFLAVAKEPSEFVDNDFAFLETMKSLRALREDEYVLAQPMRVQLITVKGGDTFSSLSQDTSFPHHKEDLLRLINGMYPEGALEVGQVIKTVR